MITTVLELRLDLGLHWLSFRMLKYSERLVIFFRLEQFYYNIEVSFVYFMTDSLAILLLSIDFSIITNKYLLHCSSVVFRRMTQLVIVVFIFQISSA